MVEISLCIAWQLTHKADLCENPPLIRINSVILMSLTAAAAAAAAQGGRNVSFF